MGGGGRGGGIVITHHFCLSVCLSVSLFFSLSGSWVLCISSDHATYVRFCCYISSALCLPVCVCCTDYQVIQQYITSHITGSYIAIWLQDYPTPYFSSVLQCEFHILLFLSKCEYEKPVSKETNIFEHLWEIWGCVSYVHLFCCSDWCMFLLL